MPIASTPRGAAAGALCALVALAACASPAPDPRYRPAENLLEVVAVLRRHVPDDTYRFPPASDFTGRNVFRSSLLRLESLEHLHADALRAGHMDGVIAFAKARALERLRAFDLAAGHYRVAAEREPSLAEEARRSAALCDGLAQAASLAVDLDALAEGGAPLPAGDVDALLAAYEERDARQEALLAAAEGSHHESVVREELERTDLSRARYFRALRKLLPDGDVRAVGELQRLVERNRDSRHVHRHLLALADLYGDLAAEYVDAHPPESLRFDPVRFQELVDAAARLYEVVAARDGTAERIEASRRLEAFLAFALRVDRDRFTR